MLKRGIEIAKIYPSTAALRMVRMGSAYGIGGISNNFLRNQFIGRIEGKDWNVDY